MKKKTEQSVREKAYRRKKRRKWMIYANNRSGIITAPIVLFPGYDYPEWYPYWIYRLFRDIRWLYPKFFRVRLESNATRLFFFHALYLKFYLRWTARQYTYSIVRTSDVILDYINKKTSNV